jgi:hypothetical protein
LQLCRLTVKAEASRRPLKRPPVPRAPPCAATVAAQQVVALSDGGALYVFEGGLMAVEDRYGRARSVKVGTVLETKDGRKITTTSNEVARLSQLLDLDHRG